MRRCFPIILLCAGGAIAAEVSYSKETYTYKQVGDLAIQADVYRAGNGGVRPVIFWIHGGALISGSRANLREEQMKRYLTAGFTVVSIDYRLAPETKAAGILEDVSDAYRWVRTTGPNLFGADPERIGVVGHSAGGYLTLTCGYRLRPRPRVLVAFYGYGDVAGDWYARPDPFYSKQPAVPKEEAYSVVGSQPISSAQAPSRRGLFYLYCRQHGLWPKEVVGHDPDSEPKAFDPFCPARNVTPEYPPTLLLHGDTDTDVPFAQSEQMAAELARRHVKYEFIRVPNRGHGFDGAMQDPAIAAIFDRAVEFLKAYLK